MNTTHNVKIKSTHPESISDISCPNCRHWIDLPAGATKGSLNCPKCGTTFTFSIQKEGATENQQTESAKSNGVKSSGFGFVGFLLFLGLLWLTNPDQAKHRKELELDGFAGVAVELLAWAADGEIKYNNYLIFSTMSAKASNGTSKTVSIGVLGFIKKLE